jgi:hypothetical protein
MWVKGKHHRRTANPPRFVEQLFNDPRVSPMHAVEVPDRHGAAAQVRRQFIQAAKQFQGRRGSEGEFAGIIAEIDYPTRDCPLQWDACLGILFAHRSCNPLPAIQQIMSTVRPCLVLAAAMLCPLPADACPYCNSEVGAQVAAEIFNQDFWSNAALVLAPIPVLLALIAWIHLGFPWPSRRAYQAPLVRADRKERP